MSRRLAATFTVICMAATGAWAKDVVVARKGEPVASGIYLSPADNGKKQQLPYAAEDLAHCIEKMTGVKVPVVEAADKNGVPDGPAIVLGELAAAFGFAPAAKTFWKDTMRTVVKDGRIYVAAESDCAANSAVMDLLHELGVRWFLPANIPGNPGEVIPEAKAVAWSERDHERHPLIRSRRVWGHNVGTGEPRGPYRPSKWVRRLSGLSAVRVPTSHAWGGLIPEEKRKPEFFAIKRYQDGQPVRGGQFCVSNPEVPGLVAETLMQRFRADPDLAAQSISPNDGGGACVCLKCQALDPPGYREPSSGKPAISDRYVYFYNKLAEELAAEFPNRYLAFLVYSDYSRAPVKFTELHPMLVPVFAPIRYPRMHSMFNLHSEQNLRLRHEIEAYAKYARHIGYYGYNYNLAETIVPFSKIDIWTRDLTFLAEKGLLHAELETLGNWNSNGAHIYLSARYIYSGEDPDDIMQDYFEKLGGAAAGPLRDYWQAVDRAYVEADIHSGSFYGIEHILTPEVLSRLQKHLKKALKAAKTEREKQVVAFFQSGLDQGKLVIEIINRLNAVEFIEADAARDKLNALSKKLQDEHVVSIYPVRYMRWFMDHVVNAAVAIPESGGKIVSVLPRTWHIRLDHYSVGIEEEWFDPRHGNGKWQTAETWGAPSLYSQGFGDFKGHQWLKVEAAVPARDADKLVMWFGSNDGSTRLWVNGEAVPFALEEGKGGQKKVVQTLEYPRGWRAFSVPVGRFLKPGGKNTFVVRIQHPLNDLNLGGILRPVLLYRPGEQELKTLTDTYEKLTM